MRVVLAADEVGRGAIAGPLAVGAVCVPEDAPRVTGAQDSKKTSAELRQSFVETFPYPFTVSYCPAAQVSREGITAALRHCFVQAIGDLVSESARLGHEVVEIRIDGESLPGLAHHKRFARNLVRFIVKGDALDWPIGAASMIAKHTRDAHMKKLAQQYPEYGWHLNMGYGTKPHTEAIHSHGLTPEHREKWCLKFLPEDSVLDLFLP